MAPGLGGGTKVIEGVTIRYTFRESDVNLVAGQQYLFLLNVCPSGQAGLTYDVASVHSVSKDGTITASLGGRPFAQELQAVGTLKRLRAIIEDVKSPRWLTRCCKRSVFA